jgi:hypothetical protein
MERFYTWHAGDHVSDLIIQAAFNKAKLHVSSGLDIAIFKRFKNAWKKLYKINILVWNTDIF